MSIQKLNYSGIFKGKIALQIFKNICFMGLLILLPALILFACKENNEHDRQVISLAGQWQFAMDTEDVGIESEWFLKDLADSITLPGTMDLNHKGFPNDDTTTLHLNRLYTYEGPAWYRKKVIIPSEFRDKHIELILERTKSARVWIDGRFAGQSRIMQSVQKYDVSGYLSPGEHFVTIRVSNDLSLTPYGNVHIYTDETQTNWNGIIGDIILQAAPKTFIKDLQLFPDIDKRLVNAKLTVENGLGLDSVDVELQVMLTLNGESIALNNSVQRSACDSVIRLQYILDNAMELWDEYRQPLYRLTAVIRGKGNHDSKSASFAMRKFDVRGRQFAINGRTVFLRGKNDACIFPLTGHPPMDTLGWLRIFKIAKSYGINHYRFHSYCPPRAAFEAADQLGIFLQAELPFWGGLDSDTLATMLKAEGQAMLTNYANHPSFVMFSAGNEIWSGHDRFEQIMTSLKKKDNRPLYTMGSNNNIGYIPPPDYAEFHVAARTPFAGDTTLTHTRLTHSFADSRDGGLLNTMPPSTMLTFDYPVSQINMPLISHEIGQYQIYPDYSEIEKYKGVVRARNLEIFRNSLAKTGMLDQDSAFQKASGMWSALCYKAEMEAALRTAQMAGFQLLDLQDFPGQGTALVGILDAFMDSKNVISREKWLQSCNDVVLLLKFHKFCWQNNEKFSAEFQVANYSNQDVTNDIIWEIKTAQGQMLQSGVFSELNLSKGRLHSVGHISTTFDGVEEASRLDIYISIKESNYSNSYPLWIYPPVSQDLVNGDITVTSDLDVAIGTLQKGYKVLLFPYRRSIMNKSVAGLFPPDFWNYGMFKNISEINKKPVSPGTLGLLTNPDHPLFSKFPTDFHSNWQWWSIIKASRPLYMDKTIADYRPLVQVIDNMERNKKLALIFELSVYDGKLLVCMARLPDLMDRPEARQLYRSIINYMQSDDFSPGYKITPDRLSEMF